MALAVLYLSVGILGSVFTGKSEESILEETILDEADLGDPPSSFREPSNLALGGVVPGHIIPAGTQLGIPHWIQQQYQMSNQKQFYNNSMMNFLMHNYGVVGPSASGLDTYYVPLSYRSNRDRDRDRDRGRDDDDDDDDDDYNYDTFMVDVTNLKQSKKEAQPSEVLEETTTPAPSPETGAGQPTDQQVVDQQATEQQATEQQVEQQATEQQAEQQPAEQQVVDQQATDQTDQPAEQQVADQQATDQTDQQANVTEGQEGTTFEVTEDYNTSDENVPEVPEYKPEEDFSKDSTPTTCEATNNTKKEEEEAEANRIQAYACVDCKDKKFLQSDTSIEQLKEFITKVNEKVVHFDKSKKFSTVITNFCKKCKPVDIKDFMQYIESRAKEENIPYEIMFSFMMRESNGKCDAKKPEIYTKSEGEYKKGDVKGCSYGLFQLYTFNSTCLLGCDENNSLSGMSSAQLKAVCQKGSDYANYRKTCKNGKQYVSDGKTCNSLKPINETIKGIKNMKGMCLNNPYCNFEEALHLLKGDKWYIGNGKTPMPELKEGWPNMSRKNRNLWRNAVVAYNGTKYEKPAKTAMKEKKAMEEAEKKGIKLDLNDWEQKRMFFVNEYVEGNSAVKKGLIENLAYVEKITGREIEGGLANSSLCQWIDFKAKNSPLSCLKKK